MRISACLISLRIYRIHIFISYINHIRYEGLGIKDIREYLDSNHPHVYAYLPEPNIELPKTPKSWLANVCATVLQDKFSEWVES